MAARPARRPRRLSQGSVIRRGARILLGFLGVFLPTVVGEAWALLPFVSDARRAVIHRRGPDRLFQWLQGLGGAFVKFGQLLSMRYDVLPYRYCHALEALFDKVPPFDVAIARGIVEEELGKPVSEVFSSFEDVPIGAASFGQIHRVTISTGPDAGKQAVVKVQRPGAVANFEVDARWLLFVGLLVDLTSVLGRIKIRPVFRDFIRWTRRELSFVLEAKNADRVHEVTDWNAHQRIPWIYWDLTTKRVLTMEYLEGIPVTDLIRRRDQGDPTLDAELAAMGCEVEVISRRILTNHYLQANVGEVFHADPHPGNLIVLPGNVIGYVDFGLIGRMSPEALREQMALMDAVATQDLERLFVAVLDLLDAPRGLLVTDTYDRFAESTDAWLDASDNPGASAQEKSATNLVIAVMDLAREIGLPLTMNTTLYFKALMSVDAGVLRLLPNQDYHGELVRVLRVVRLRMIERRMEPGNAVDRALTTTLFALQLPDFAKEQVIQYQQATRTMYRKFNRVPLVIAGLMRSASVGLLASVAALLPLDLGTSAHLPPAFVQLVHLDYLERIASGWPLGILGAFALWWGARVVSAQSLVKVQRDTS